MSNFSIKIGPRTCKSDQQESWTGAPGMAAHKLAAAVYDFDDKDECNQHEQKGEGVAASEDADDVAVHGTGAWRLRNGFVTSRQGTMQERSRFVNKLFPCR